MLFISNQKLVQAQTTLPQKRFTISGYVKEQGSSELLIGTSIAIPSLKTGTISNNYGFYSLTLPEGRYQLLVSYIGFEPKAFFIDLNKNLEWDIILEPAKALKEVVVSAEKQTAKLADVTQMSVIEIPVQQIKDIPALMGEKDVLKVIQLLPGVQKGGEGNSGIYVRGGGPDQNLIILDDAIVYNAFHLFGFFSLFNGDALKSVELTKGGFPARFGGRLSSVLEMNMKEGNKEKLKGEAGIGLIASRLLLEGPIIKGKSSFLVSARRTYVDVLTLPFQEANSKGGYYFYDFNAKTNYEINHRNKIFLSGYFGRDKFYFYQKDAVDATSAGGLRWGNASGTLRWNHQYTPKVFSNTSFIFSDYKFELFENQKVGQSVYSLNYSSGIRDFSFKHDLDFRPNANHTIKAGIQIIRHLFTPSAIVTKDDFSGTNTNTKNTIVAYENAIYLEDDIKIGPKFRVNPGLRISQFNVGGLNYFKPEPRISAAYKVKSDLAIKASYAVMNQYVHLVSNTGVGLPTDLWVPTTKVVKPQNSWQLAGGVAKDFLEKNFSVSMEGYYKQASNIISYKEGASFLSSDPTEAGNSGSTAWEDNLTTGKMWSYGAEFFVQKKTGNFTGWIGYTLSWTQMQFEELNFGEKFWAKYDRRHDISLVGIYKIREETATQNGVKLSATWVYGTGNAITLPIAEYDAPIHQPGHSSGNSGYYNTVSQYTSKNNFRMAPYHRMDFAVQVEKRMKHWVRTWEFSVYNLYNRYNPYFYYIGYPGTSTNRTLMQITIFPIVPSVSWNIKF
ncbi:MAG: TonB-dependent receptor [Bacteroidetes bacterium B1(2017)]|nr:MAG: TonB-dependent receptor [Bacteroidetes bacterium B1(2017)]